MELVYRGVSERMYQRDGGRILPKAMGKPFASIVCCGHPHAVCASGVECGESAVNELVAHQWQTPAPTSGISTTPYRERATKYALRNGHHATGHIFWIDLVRLRGMGARVYRVNELLTVPWVPDDDEFTIVTPDLGALPLEAIVHVERIERAG